ncbi:hypothetical protein OGAPHI_003588 [Ogataea philodendri]|uniref:Checkpoint protein RAD24-like helical bundle domain-containing protein n=1 Tax=Ogataea philodendri TaxID=1378263 RepID=A0A9P8T4M3_9ASCO|nr:uncharacterized protein OGAPHI_003588 [Ogataea philodendri]KAH3665404.1 hypothetical protein OGAPHI_003588 [Ogataea philodendri]
MAQGENRQKKGRNRNLDSNVIVISSDESFDSIDTETELPIVQESKAYCKSDRKKNIDLQDDHARSIEDKNYEEQLGRVKRLKKPTDVAGLLAKLQVPNGKKLHQRCSSPSKKNTLTWVEKYCPFTSSELCIHERKIHELKLKLHDMIHNNTSMRLLILSGPAGSGKSVSAKIICEELMRDKHKNSGNHMKIDHISIEHRLDHVIEYMNWATSTSKDSSSVTNFGEFLEGCKVLTARNQKCIVVEELPNLHHPDTLKQFRSSLTKWILMDKKVNLPPLIICLTEYEVANEFSSSMASLDSNFKTELVLGSEIMSFEGSTWGRIKFNPVAKRYVKKCLTRIASAEDRTITMNKGISRYLINSRIEQLSPNGDLRNAIILFEYWVKFCASTASDAQFLGKESGLNLFHSIGKLLYGTQHPEEEYKTYIKKAHIPTGSHASYEQVKFNIDYVTVVNVVTDVMRSASTFGLNLLENYLSIATSVNPCIDKLADSLSISDNLSLKGFESSSFNGSPTMDEISTTVGCLGTRIESKRLKTISSKPSSFVSLRFSRDLKSLKKSNSIRRETIEYSYKRTTKLIKSSHYSYASVTDLLTCDGFYEHKILNSKKLMGKLKDAGFSRSLHFRRLGGDFKNFLLADTELKPIEEEEDGFDSEGGLKAREKLEELYFGFGNNSDSPESDDEFVLDPIVFSDDNNYSDEFSDDSLVLQL